GLGAVGRVLGNYLSEARSYELQGISRYAARVLDDRHHRLLIVDRFFPVVGEYFSSFGAFVRQEYRIHDYVIGLYDGLHAIAVLQASYRPECKDRDFSTSACAPWLAYYFGQAVQGLVQGDV